MRARVKVSYSKPQPADPHFYNGVTEDFKPHWHTQKQSCKNEELKKELEAERKKVEDASVALTSDEITIDFGSDSIRG